MIFVKNSILIIIFSLSCSYEIFGGIYFKHMHGEETFNYPTLIKQAESKLRSLLHGKPPHVVKQMKTQKTEVSQTIDAIDGLKAAKQSLDQRELSFVEELPTASEIERLADSMKEKNCVIGNLYAGMKINSAIAALSKEFNNVIVSTQSAPTWNSYRKSFIFNKEEKLNIYAVKSRNGAVSIYDVKGSYPSDLPKDLSYSSEWLNTSEQIKKAYDRNNRKDDDIVEEIIFGRAFFEDNLKLKDDFLILENFIKLLELKYSLKFIENPKSPKHKSYFYAVDSESVIAIRLEGSSYRGLEEMSIILLPKSVVSSDNEELIEALNAFD